MIKAADIAPVPSPRGPALVGESDWVELRILVSFRSPDAVVMHVRGELDFHSAPALAGHVGECGSATRLVLDCSGVTFADLAGLRAIHAMARAVRAGGQDLVLVDSAALRVVTSLACGTPAAAAITVAAAVDDPAPGHVCCHAPEHPAG